MGGKEKKWRSFPTHVSSLVAGYKVLSKWEDSGGRMRSDGLGKGASGTESFAVSSPRGEKGKKKGRIE